MVATSPKKCAAKPAKYESLACLRGFMYHIARDQHGYRFLQQRPDDGKREVDFIFAGVARHAVELMVNPFGNYLMQKLLTVCNDEQRMGVVLTLTKEALVLVRISLNVHGMQVKPSTQPIIVVLPLCHSDDTESARASRKQYKETLYSVLFDMNVPAVCAVDQALLALYAAKRTSGIVVNIGFNATSIVPIFQGRVMHEIGVETVGQGAHKLTGFLKELMQRRNIPFESLYTVRTIKEKLCYVAADYEAELRKDTRASCKVDGEGWFTLSEERFKTAEILFQPQIGGIRAMGLHKAVSLCMDHCYSSEVFSDNSWFKTVVLAGGSSCLPGLPERLEKELHKLLPAYISEGIRVLSPSFGTDSAWFGAKMISTVSTFTEAWCIKKKQFRQKIRRNGPSFVSAW